MRIPLAAAFWALIFLVSIPADLLTGYLIYFGPREAGGIFSPSQLMRLIITAFIAYRLTALPNRLLAVVALGLYLLLLELFSLQVHKNLSAFSYGIVSAVKLTALFATTFLVFDQKDRKYILLFFRMALVVISAILCISVIADFGRSTYAAGGFGSKSFFASGNGLGLYLGAGTLALVVLDIRGRLKLNTWAMAVLSLGLLSLATKAALSFLIVSLLLRLSHKSKEVFMVGAASVVAYLIFGAELNALFYQVLEIPIHRWDQANGDVIWFLTSARNLFIMDAIQGHLDSPNPLKILFGSGAFVGFQDPSTASSVDLLEADLFDVYFIYGFLGLAIYGALFAKLFKRLCFSHMLCLIGAAILLHSAFLGHMIFNGLMINLFIALLAISVELKSPSYKRGSFV